jgi:DNA-binding CsgD family transcriptional regulator
MRGQWGEALEIADHTGEDPPPTPRAMLESVVLAVAAGRGDVTALSRLPALRERWHREGLIAVVGGGAAIELLSARDGAAAAVALYDDVCAVLSPLWTREFGARLRLATLALAALADEAPRTATAARENVRETAARIVAEGERVVDSRAAEGRPLQVEGQAWASRLQAERLRLEWLLGGAVALDDLLRRWAETAELFAELGHPLEEARARTRLAVVLRATGDADEGLRQAERARELASRLGARPLVDELGSFRTVSVHDGKLTPREAEILGLVATGRSNAEIGQQLFISAKTVSVHVSNVMAKLGASSRTEAVALARQAGLLD